MTFSKKHKTAPKSATEENPPSQVPDASGGGSEEESAREKPAKGGVQADPSPPVVPGENSAPATPDQPSEADRLKDRLLRLQADFDNYRKRMVRERMETMALANAELLSDLLTPLDHMERAISLMQQTAGRDDALLQGIRLVRTEWLAAMERFGLKAMTEIEGRRFDPTQQEALGMAAAPGVEEGHVAAVVRAGYTLNGRVLRAAQVMVAAGSPVEPQAVSAEDGED